MIIRNVGDLPSNDKTYVQADLSLQEEIGSDLVVKYAKQQMHKVVQ